MPGDGINCLEIPGVDAFGVSCTTGRCEIGKHGLMVTRLFGSGMTGLNRTHGWNLDTCSQGYTVSADQSSCIPN